MSATASRPWLDVLQPSGARRLELRAGLTRLGGPETDLALAGWTAGELHLWDQPPRAIWAGGGSGPRLNGAPLAEADLAPGDRIEWGEVRLVFHGGEGPEDEGRSRAAASAGPAPRSGVLEEIPLEPAPSAAPSAVPGAVPVDPDDPRSRLYAKLLAGLLAEQGLADRAETQRWQDAVLRGEFDADAAARDLLRRAPTSADDPQLVGRADRLMRDLLMAPVTRGIRGASRRARGAAQSGTAFVLAQLVGILVYTAVVLVVMLLVRVKWGVSFDGFFDGILGR